MAKAKRSRSRKEIRKMIDALELSGFECARDIAKGLDWALGNEPAPLLRFYIQQADRGGMK